MAIKPLDDIYYPVADVIAWLKTNYERFLPCDVEKFIYDNFLIKPVTQTRLITKRLESRSQPIRQIKYETMLMIQGSHINNYVDDNFTNLSGDHEQQEEYFIKLALEVYGKLQELEYGARNKLAKKFSEKHPGIGERVGTATWDRLAKKGKISSNHKTISK